MMQRKSTFLILLVLMGSVCLLFALLLPSERSAAQGNPTHQRQTLDAIVNPRLSLTARLRVAQTATAFAELLQTQDYFLTQTQIAQTATATPSPTPTGLASSSPTATLLPTLTLIPSDTSSPAPTLLPSLTYTPSHTSSPTPSPQPSNTSMPTLTPNATELLETIVYDVGQSLTRTALAQDQFAATAAYRETFNAVLWATLGITATPAVTPSATLTPTSMFSLTPVDPTDQYATLIADIDRRLTGTAFARQTVNAQRTIDAIIAGTLQITPTSTATLTPTITTTPNAIEIQQTLDARVNLSFTATAAAVLAQTATLSLQKTVNAIVNQGQTATADAVRQVLSNNHPPIATENVAQLNKGADILAHTAAVNSAAFNGIGNQFATASSDNLVRLWDTLSGWNLFTWTGLTDRVSVAISADGTLLAAGSSDGTVRVWDLITRAERAILTGHTGAVRAVAFSPDSSYIASASADRSVRLWDARTGRQVRALGSNRNYLAAATSLAFSADGLRLAVGSEDAQIHLWEVSSGVLITRIRDLHRASGITLSPDGKLVATIGNSNSIVVWTLTEQPTRILLRGGFTFQSSFAFDPSGTLIAAGNQAGQLTLWNLNTQEIVFTKTAYPNVAINTLVFSPNRTHLLIGAANGSISLWSVRSQ